MKIEKEKKSIVISGDFNLDFLLYDRNEMISNFLNTMLMNNLQPCITEPTRIVNNCRPSLVDNIFINTLGNTYSGNILEDTSYDHLTSFIITESEQFRPNADKNIKRRDINNFDQKVFENELHDPNLYEQIELTNCSNKAYNIFHKKILAATSF